MPAANQVCRFCYAAGCAGDCGTERSPRVRRHSSEVWTRQLTALECARRKWDWRPTTWTERFPLPEGKCSRPVTRDLFGFIDCIAASKEHGTVAIQFCAAGDISKRRAKIVGHDNFAFVRALGWRVVVWGFRESGVLVEEVIAE